MTVTMFIHTHPPTTTTTITSFPDYTPAFFSSTSSLEYTHRHVPISVALYSGVPGLENPVCLVGNGEPQSLINDMMTYLDKMTDAVCEHQMRTFQPVFVDTEKKTKTV